MEPYIHQELPIDMSRWDWQKLIIYVSETSATLACYNGILKSMINPAIFLSPLETKEAVLSSRIEDTVATIDNAHLFIVADPTQGFLGRGASWRSLGLQARGRSQQLRRSYRTTREILEFASLFYRHRLTEENEEDILAPDLRNMPNGALPEMIALSSSQDEISRVANEVEAFVHKGYPRKHLLILHANGQGVRSLKDAINRRLGRNAAMDPKDSYPEIISG